MRKLKAFLALVLTAITLLGTIPVSAVTYYTYPMDWTVYYKSTDGTLLGTKTGTVDASDDERNGLSVTSPSYSGYSLQSKSDGIVTGRMISWTYPATNYNRRGTGTYTVYYEKNVTVTIYYLYGSTKKTAATAKTVTGAPSATYSVTSPSVTGYSPNATSVSDKYSAGNKTVYYYEKTYTISFNANGGSGAPSSVTKSHFTDLTLPTTTPTKTGNTFLGWASSSGATSATWSAGGTFSTNAATTLYAVWQPKSYSLKFNANGGSGAPSTQTKYYGTDLTISSTKPTRTGYSFVGWGTSSSATTVAYNPGGTYSTNSTKTLYAIWTPQTYTISYNANGGSGAPAAQTKYYGQDYAISSTKPSRSGYSFMGWATSKSGTPTYSAGNTYKENASITLYAVWSCNHSATTKSWTDDCHWKTTCDTCGATIKTGAEHGPFSYGVWTYDTDSQHKRTVTCDHGDYTSSETAAHSTAVKYETYTATQHKKYDYCDGCSAKIGFESYESHAMTTSTKGGKIISVCSQCGYTTSEDVRYTISYNANGGSGAPSSQTKTHGVDLTLSSTKPTRTGYTFKGWSTKTTGAAEYSSGATYKGNASVTLYAIWSCNHSSTTKSWTDDCHWKTTCDTCGATISTGTEHGPFSYGDWTYDSATQHKRTVICDHGDYSSSETASHSTTVKYETHSATQHKKYNYCSDCSTKIGSESYENHSMTSITKDGKIISVCSQCGYSTSQDVTYTISYDANGGNGAPAAQTKTHGVDLTLSSTKPSKTGYTFKGWSTSKTGSVVYASGETYKSNAALTLYAVWSCSHSATTKSWTDDCHWKTTCDTCGATIKTGAEHGPFSYGAWTYDTDSQHKRTVTCDHGDYTSSETAAHSTAVKYETYTATQHKKYDYCDGCSAKIGSESYESHAMTTSTKGGKIISVCSQCGYTTSKDVTYTISYNANGGAGAPSSQTKTYGIDLTLASTKPTRTGYTFKGWSTSSSATTAGYAAGDTFSTDADTTLYAVWKKNTYTVKYDANGGSGTPASQTKTYGVSLTLSSTKPTRDNYDFLGWSTSQSATTATYAAGGSYTANSGATLYAVWSYSPSTYTVSYDANGGSGAPAAQTKTYGVSLTLSSTKPTRYNYTFMGWATSATATTASYNPGDAYTENKATALYAVWSYTPAKYTVSYNANGGTNAPANQTKVYEVTLTLTTDEPEREGYNFLGWSTFDTAKRAEYAPGSEYIDNCPAILYAVWALKTYTVTYDANGGSGSIVAQTKKHGQSLTLTTSEPTWYNHRFMGWATSKTAMSVEYYPGETYEDNADVTMYAVWVKMNYDFSVTELTVTPEVVDPYDKVSIRFRADNWDKNLPYEDIPIEVYVDGKCVYDTKVDFTAFGIQYVSFDMTVGEKTGTFNVEARINWDNRENELLTNNNVASSSYKVEDKMETSVTKIDVNSEYIEGTDVISSFYAVNESTKDIIPDDAVSFDFLVYTMKNGSLQIISQQTCNNVVIPSGGTNLVYFKWQVPENSAGQTIYVKGSVNAAGASEEKDATNNVIEFAVCPTSQMTSQTPNTRYEKKAPSTYNPSVSTPTEKAGSAKWNMWVYEGGKFVLKSYGIAVTGTNPMVAPSAECSTAVKMGSTYTMKSGYGITVNWNPVIVTKSGYSMPGSDAYTAPQLVYATFPEFGYSTAIGKCRTLLKVGTSYQFAENSDSDKNERVHFIPVYVKDGNYTVSVTATGIWTPAGMITATRNANAITINGTIYDDWYQGTK